MTTVKDHHRWCTEHITDGFDRDPTEVDFCLRRVRFPGGSFDLHNADGPVVVECFIDDAEDVGKGMTPAQAAEFAVALTEALMLNAQAAPARG